MKRWLCIGLCACLFLLSGCASAKPLSRDTFALDTTCSVTIYDGGDETLLDECVRLIAAREALWSRTKDDSDIARLNAADGAPVTVDEATASLISTAIALAGQTNGAFDVTALALTQQWEQAEKSGVLPRDEELAAALTAVGVQHIGVSGSTVTLRNGVTLDLGAIAKGQIGDDVAALLKERGCTSAIIELGGNVVAVGEKPNGDPFRVGIADPRNPNEMIATVAVRDCAVVTSGSYERGFTVAGKRYSHILDPNTGKPVDNDLLSVTILCASSTTADALSTACFVMGFDRAKVLVDSLDGVEAVFVKTGGETVATAGVTLV
ncbi:MAG: FAD:protein FMN transferase [Clostridia bacterium]|nr:FAD:protein FMN transferase [Clostridia bacterium]